MEVATVTLAGANEEADLADAQLKSLEAQVADAREQEEEEEETQQPCVEDLSLVLTKLLSAIKADSTVDPALANLAEQHSSTLVQGLSQIISAMDREKQDQARQQAEAQGVRRRLRGKRPPVSVSPIRKITAEKRAKVRLAGKTSSSSVRTFGSYFRAARQKAGIRRMSPEMEDENGNPVSDMEAPDHEL